MTNVDKLRKKLRSIVNNCVYLCYTSHVSGCATFRETLESIRDCLSKSDQLWECITVCIDICDDNCSEENTIKIEKWFEKIILNPIKPDLSIEDIQNDFLMYKKRLHSVEELTKKIVQVVNKDYFEYDNITKPLVNDNSCLFAKVIESITSQHKKYSIIKTGISFVDTRCPIRLNEACLFTIGGRPGSGKSTFAINLIINMCRNNPRIRVLFISAEMSALHVTERIASCLCKKNINLITVDEFKENCNFIKDGNFFISDNNRFTVDFISHICEQTKPNIIIIDHLHRLFAYVDGGYFAASDKNAVSLITGQLANLTRSKSIPIICLSQLSRSIETRSSSSQSRKSDKTIVYEPMLSDYRESGSIEQDSDICVTIVRNGTGDGTTLKLHVLKNREGQLCTGEVLVNFNTHTITNIDINNNYRDWSDVGHSNQRDDSEDENG